jgi:hypothetical protein
MHLKNFFTFERRCTGHCCKGFILPSLSPEQFKEKKRDYKINQKRFKKF